MGLAGTCKAAVDTTYLMRYPDGRISLVSERDVSAVDTFECRAILCEGPKMTSDARHRRRLLMGGWRFMIASSIIMLVWAVFYRDDLALLGLGLYVGVAGCASIAASGSGGY